MEPIYMLNFIVACFAMVLGYSLLRLSHAHYDDDDDGAMLGYGLSGGVISIGACVFWGYNLSWVFYI